MPRLPIDYSKTIIYKIVCNDLNICDVYVGSTTDFIRRKGKHKSDCNSEKSKGYNRKVYQTIRQNGGWNNFSMILVEYYPCTCSIEAHTRERYYYELLNASLNTNVPSRTTQEYKQKYREANKKKIAEQKKEYIEANKEKLKQYRLANKDKIAEQKKKYREANKEKINEKQRLKREAKKQN